MIGGSQNELLCIDHFRPHRRRLAGVQTQGAHYHRQAADQSALKRVETRNLGGPAFPDSVSTVQFLHGGAELG